MCDVTTQAAITRTRLTSHNAHDTYFEQVPVISSDEGGRVAVLEGVADSDGGGARARKDESGGGFDAQLLVFAVDRVVVLTSAIVVRDWLRLKNTRGSRSVKTQTRKSTKLLRYVSQPQTVWWSRTCIIHVILLLFLRKTWLLLFNCSMAGDWHLIKVAFKLPLSRVDYSHKMRHSFFLQCIERLSFRMISKRKSQKTHRNRT